MRATMMSLDAEARRYGRVLKAESKELKSLIFERGCIQSKKGSLTKSEKNRLNRLENVIDRKTLAYEEAIKQQEEESKND